MVYYEFFHLPVKKHAGGVRGNTISYEPYNKIKGICLNISMFCLPAAKGRLLFLYL